MSQLESLMIEGFAANGHSAEDAKAATAALEGVASQGYGADGALLAFITTLLKNLPTLLPYLPQLLPLFFDAATIAKFQRFLDVLKLLFPQTT